ncbi:MAG: rhodanese-like domain-containing protein [Candidatus Thiodiazotropha sp.]|jgi:rhodanese-related sulfurtransferase
MNKQLSRFILSTILSLLLLSVATAETAGNLPAKKQTEVGLYLTAKEAYKLKTEKSDTIFVDVRTRSEVTFLGMPMIADANIPFEIPNGWNNWSEEKKTFKLQKNSDFLASVEKLVKAKGGNKNTSIIFLCRSGSRSAKATNLLAQNGYSKVYTVTDGYEGDKAKSGDQKGQRVVNGWKNSGLPWSYKLDKTKMYGLQADT